jgi:nucleotide-binding universal stress UspA family protein
MIDINRILCPIDFSEFSAHALTYATRMAGWYGATLRVVHVMPVMPPSAVSPLAETSRQLTERNLRTAIERARLPGVEIESELLESGDPAAKIIECAEADNADVIVTGSHGRSGVRRMLLGSVVESLLHKSRRPVLAIPSHLDPVRLGNHLAPREIVCAVDFSTPSLTALAHALSLAEETDAHLTLLHVIEMPPELARAPELARMLASEGGPEPPAFDVAAIRAEAEADCLVRLRKLVPEHARDYCTIETSVLEGGVSHQILRLAANRSADLIVLGVHGRNAIDIAVFGSNSKDVIRSAHCPVLVVPAGRRRRSTPRAASYERTAAGSRS